LSVVAEAFSLFYGRFLGCFGKSWWLDVVLWWTERGEMRGKRGRLTDIFSRRKMGH
jgi:hypothetical protein